MTEKREVCTCTKCGNEAEMIIKCEWVEVGEGTEKAKKQQKQTKQCTVCGNEADMILDFQA